MVRARDVVRRCPAYWVRAKGPRWGRGEHRSHDRTLLEAKREPGLTICENVILVRSRIRALLTHGGRSGGQVRKVRDARCARCHWLVEDSFYYRTDSA